MGSTRKRDGGRRHDSASIRRLIAQQRATGASYASLAERAGIPVGTLAWWCQPTPLIAPRSVATTVDEAAIVYLRRKTVRKNGKTHELQRLVAALESSC
jgi:hypothetical protein